MPIESHSHKRCETLRKKLFSAREYAEIHMQKLFFKDKIATPKVGLLKIQMMDNASSTCGFLFF
jgi:hypothetical protein